MKKKMIDSLQKSYDRAKGASKYGKFEAIVRGKMRRPTTRLRELEQLINDFGMNPEWEAEHAELTTELASLEKERVEARRADRALKEAAK